VARGSDVLNSDYKYIEYYLYKFNRYL